MGQIVMYLFIKFLNALCPKESQSNVPNRNGYNLMNTRLKPIKIALYCSKINSDQARIIILVRPGEIKRSPMGAEFPKGLEPV